MGLLDDAIREHLALKRRRGADPSEVARQEREALSPVRRDAPAAAQQEPADQDVAVATSGDAPAAEGPGGSPFDIDEVSGDYATSSGAGSAEPPTFVIKEAETAGEAPAPEPDDLAQTRIHRPAADEQPDPGDEGAAEGSSPRGAGAEREPASEPDWLAQATTEYDVAAELEAAREREAGAQDAGDEDRGADLEEARGGDLDEEEDDEPFDDEPRRSAASADDADEASDDEPRHADDDDADADEPWDDEPRRSAADADDENDDDVLEETPDFLQDTPEHDRLWFEQKPPRDFDFDD